MSDEAQETRVVDLAHTSWPRLLFALLSQRFTGSVAVGQPEPEVAQRMVVFWGGFPVWTDWQVPGTRIGELLIEAELIDEATLNQAVADRGEDDIRIGEFLVQQELVTGDLVGIALRDQCERRLESIFVVGDGEITISGDPILSEEAADALTPARVLRVIQRGVALHYGAQRIDSEMAGYGGVPLRVTSSFEKYKDRFGLEASELGALERFASAERIDVADLATSTDVDWGRTLQLLYTLWACQMIVPADDTSSPIAIDLPKLEALVIALQERIQSGAGAHEVLGIDKDADLTTIEAAWQRLASQLDPMMLPEGTSEAMAAHVTEVRTAIDEVRTASRARREALAEMSAARLVREGKHVKALVLLEDLVALRPDDRTARASLAWCRYQTSTRSERDAVTALKALDAVLKEDAQMAECHYFRGHLLRDVGRSPAALAAFDQALALNPDNVDAQRQARAIRSGVPPTKERTTPDRIPEFKPKGPPKQRHAFWSGPWPAIWILTGLLLLGMGTAQIVMRLDF